MYNLLLVLCFVQHDTTPTEYCDAIEINHVYTIKEEFNKISVEKKSYILGRKWNKELSIYVVDWWTDYNNEYPIVRYPKYKMLVSEKSTGRLFMVIFDRFSIIHSNDDLEVEQKEYILKKFSIDIKIYRTGLGK